MPQAEVDVLVIGSGAAGAAVTKRLTDLGAKVLCLEQGGWIRASDYPSTKPNWELQIHRGSFHFSPNVRKRWEDYPVAETGANPPGVLMFNAVGGSTHHWAAHFPRFHPSDFRARTLDGVADDWPIRYQDLERYYDMNDVETGVAGLNGDPANPRARLVQHRRCRLAFWEKPSAKASTNWAGIGGCRTMQFSRKLTIHGQPVECMANAYSAARSAPRPPPI
jgi:choline dehydrogenase-like flavoprotein